MGLLWVRCHSRPRCERGQEHSRARAWASRWGNPRSLGRGGCQDVGKSICFVVTQPNVREIWAANYRDRIVHHLIYNRISDLFTRTFSADSCACIPERGTLYGAKRLEKHIRKATESWRKEVYYLKCDLSNFFVSIDKEVLWAELEKKLPKGWITDLTKLVLFNDPRIGCVLNSPKWKFENVELRKRLSLCSPNTGLPIGNLTSQFFANVLLNVIDQFVKHELKCKYYIRYVDDMVLLHEDTKQLKLWELAINQKLRELGMCLNPRKTVIQSVHRGVSFVGHRISKRGREIAPTPKRRALSKIAKTFDPTFVDAHVGYLSQLNNNEGYINALLAIQLTNGCRSNATLKAMQVHGINVYQMIRTGTWRNNRYLVQHFKSRIPKIRELEMHYKTLRAC